MNSGPPPVSLKTGVRVACIKVFTLLNRWTTGPIGFTFLRLKLLHLIEKLKETASHPC